ncbi:hypothetical protein D3C78_841520 [compost metagenome]
MYQRQRLFGLHARGARRHPVCRIKKQRLGLDPGLRATCMEQAFANLETAPGMGVQRQPAVYAHQRANGAGMLNSQLQSDQCPQRVTDHGESRETRVSQSLIQLVGHISQRVSVGELPGIIAGAALVVTYHLIFLLQRGELWQPVAAASPQSGNQHHHGRVGEGGRRNGYFHGSLTWRCVQRWRFQPTPLASPARTGCKIAPVFRRGKTPRRFH